ncbi:MAG: peptidoglycan-binding protein [Candidatus Gracilibacteria bacterium]|jgi:peptidoglycan hydrolase-like protein with peptidoglycan-binding domain/3D (Asp-Asp-Asp) domain-containing protein
MIVKKTFALVFSSLFMALQVSGTLLALAEDSVPPPPEEEAEYYIQTFIITAYYSPLLGQQNYVTGSYEGDITLNGRGTNGADGTPVFPGMIAAPKSYPFGLKIYIPGVGTTSVNDRGGAIVTAGNRGNSYDRLDIWMGHGDEGLRAALGWGKRTVECRVYGVKPEIEAAVYFDQYLTVENIYTQTFLNTLEFPDDLYYGDSGEEITKMQQYLVDWGYLTETNGFYGADTAQALFEFQTDYAIVSDSEELGAGHFGPQTRRKFDDLILGGVSDEMVKLQKGQSLMSKYPHLFEEKESFGTALTLGDSGETVTRLQEELQTLGFLRIAPTGLFGESTAHALYKFQQSQGIVTSETDSGAGYLGPQTRSALNSILASRYESKSLMAYQREELEAGRLALMMPDKTLASLQKEDF